MALPKGYIHNRRGQTGITMMEVLMVIGILSIIATFTASLTMSDYRGNSFRNERDKIVSALDKARSQAVNNMCFGPSCTDGKPHGLRLEADRYIIFQGSSFSARDTVVDEVIKADSNISRSGSSEIVFSQLSGDVSSSGNINVSDGFSRSSVITINSEGGISWTN